MVKSVFLSDHCTWEMRILLFSIVVTTPLRLCSVENIAWDPLASVGRMLTILGFWLAAHSLARFIAGVQKAGFDVHDVSLTSGSAAVLGYEVSPGVPVLLFSAMVTSGVDAM